MARQAAVVALAAAAAFPARGAEQNKGQGRDIDGDRVDAYGSEGHRRRRRREDPLDRLQAEAGDDPGEERDRSQELMERVFNRALGAARRSIRSLSSRARDTEREQSHSRRRSTRTYAGANGDVISTGDSVVWDGARGTHAAGHVSRFDSNGDAVVLFRDGHKRRVSPRELSRPPTLSIGDPVMYVGDSKQVPRGSLGKVVRFDKRNQTVVKFAEGGRIHVPPADLRRPALLDVGMEVTWTGSDDDVPLGSSGRVVRFDSKGNVVVRFGGHQGHGGTKKHISPADLRMPAVVGVGDHVQWKESDKDTPKGSIGKVLRVDSKGDAVVRFREGHRRHIPIADITRVEKAAGT